MGGGCITNIGRIWKPFFSKLLFFSDILRKKWVWMWIHSDSEVKICVSLFMFHENVTVVFNIYFPTYLQWCQYQLQQFGSDAHYLAIPFSTSREYTSGSPTKSQSTVLWGKAINWISLTEVVNANETWLINLSTST